MKSIKKNVCDVALALRLALSLMRVAVIATVNNTSPVRPAVSESHKPQPENCRSKTRSPAPATQRRTREVKSDGPPSLGHLFQVAKIAHKACIPKTIMYDTAITSVDSAKKHVIALPRQRQSMHIP
ncbi:MAG: hypothetical protein HYX63_07925 [Gammaproteobacteria bacterium]|nr:hypothetical protein [Gammaproteobacteria bacterium]